MQRVIKGVLLDRIKLETRVEPGLLQRAKNSAFILFMNTVYKFYLRYLTYLNILVIIIIPQFRTKTEIHQHIFIKVQAVKARQFIPFHYILRDLMINTNICYYNYLKLQHFRAIMGNNTKGNHLSLPKLQGLSHTADRLKSNACHIHVCLDIKPTAPRGYLSLLDLQCGGFNFSGISSSQ